MLLLSGILSAPWDGVAAPTALCGLCGVIGFVYSLVVARRLKKQNQYEPVFEDWLFHVLLPMVAYAVLTAATYVGRSRVGPALFGIAVAALLLLFIGVHNAWDSVTYLVLVRRHEQQKELKPHD